MATIRKRAWRTPSGAERTAWIVSYSVAGRRHIKTLPSKKAAEAWRAETLHEIARGVHAPASTSITVEKAAEMWLTQCRTDGLEAATLAQYDQHARLHINPLLGSIRLAELSSASVVDYRNTLITKQRKSRALAAKILTSLGAILACAQAAGLASRNVVREQQRDTGRRARKLDKRHDKRLEAGVDLPTKDELRAILRAAEGLETRWRSLITTLIFTGLRASELRGLRWSDVDLAGSNLTVRQRADRYQEIGSPKSAAGKRTVPFAPIVANTLREWRLACPRGPLDLVFPNGAGGVEQLHIITTALKACQLAAGIKGDGRAPKYGLHSFRHAAASLFIDLGLSPKRIQALMGHSSIGVTFDVYGHLFPSPDDDAAAMLRLQTALA